MMKKLLKSMFVLTAVAALVTVGTRSFFSDTEESTGNLLQAGALDLKIDSQCHYYRYDPTQEGAITENEAVRDWMVGYYDYGCPEVAKLPGEEGPILAPVGTWEETDLGLHKFIWLDDVKPGDWWENTISFHVYDNDAWGRVRLSGVNNYDNGCTEPELEYPDGSCGNPGQSEGELQDYMSFMAWLDQGQVPGFQNGDNSSEDDDQWEGDNKLQPEFEPLIGREDVQMTDGLLTLDLAPAMSAWWLDYCAQVLGVNPNGHNGYNVCHGLARDGRLVASTTYYIGLAGRLPSEVGNIVQTDSVMGDLMFDVVQHRNNPNPWVTPTPLPL